jgi:NAD-dependent dihydropyrimidine dehydrogenase PreA subunit
VKIDADKCVGCLQCVPYCPVQAIKKPVSGGQRAALIDQDECVECGVCLRSNVCPQKAIYWPELTWPRSIRQAFSAVLVGYDALERAGIHGYKATSSGGGRGTSEMKTNDVTGRYREGEIGIGAELGRPGVGFSFRDLEKVAVAMKRMGCELEPENPVTVLLDPETGRIKYRELLNERALSAIVETKVEESRMIEVLEALRSVAREVDTVITVDLISKCISGKIPIMGALDEAGIKVRINGKTNVGLGRPLIP